MATQPHISFEFFAAKTEQGRQKLQITCEKLNRYNPEFYSVTYGAGGSTRDTTKQLVLDLQQEGYEAAPHLSFGGVITKLTQAQADYISVSVYGPFKNDSYKY